LHLQLPLEHSVMLSHGWHPLIVLCHIVWDHSVICLSREFLLKLDLFMLSYGDRELSLSSHPLTASNGESEVGAWLNRWAQNSAFPPAQVPGMWHREGLLLLLRHGLCLHMASTQPSLAAGTQELSTVPNGPQRSPDIRAPHWTTWRRIFKLLPWPLLVWAVGLRCSCDVILG
jgi:hypothetical protein